MSAPILDTVFNMAVEGRWPPAKVDRVMALARYAEARREPVRTLRRREPRRVWIPSLHRQVTLA